jgi:DNA-binding FadR family transcriptional regulator
MDFQSDHLAAATRARKVNLFSHVVDEVGRRIVRGDWKPGQTLPPEAELGRELGASRSVVREAVKSLAGKGLLEPRARTGTRVLAPIHWNLLDLDVLEWRYAAMPRSRFLRELFEIRHLIEPAGAALAAERATAAEVDALAQACAAMETRGGAPEAAIDADLRFHRAILAASHNDLLLQMGAVIGAGLATSFRISSRSYDVFVPLHRETFEAIRDRRPADARSAMERLLSGTLAFLERELATRGDGQPDVTPPAGGGSATDRPSS